MRRVLLLLLGVFILAVRGAAPAADVPEQEEKHWSLRPRSRPPVPAFTNAADRAWVRNPVDAFILAKLRAHGLRPAPEADRRTLLRRLSFDLTGLPPTPAESDAFVNDAAPNAYEKQVERLLASPHYGERWGRHWLDVVRYAETDGFEYDRYRAGAFRYRDYVLRVFNEDRPFDRFIREQLAGDEMGAQPELQVAAGFLRLGPVRRNAGNVAIAFSRNEVLTERTDALGAIFLGLTVGCARCHDHKFDDISQADYYRLQAFLAEAHEHDVVLADAKTQADWKARMQQVKAEIARLQKAVSAAHGAQRESMQRQLRAAEGRLPAPLPALGTVHNFPERRTPIHILKRGNEERKGKKVGPRFLGALIPETTPALAPDVDRPRTRLAKWITTPDHPLTARVLANRLWLYHFGRGIVATANDFGVNGARPSHPELLEHLANELVAGGWRLKRLHRLIVLSSTYRQASRVAPPLTSNPSPPRGEGSRIAPRPLGERGWGEGVRRDPDNRFLWRFPRRRLAAEEIRDAMLVAAGVLNHTAGGPSIVLPIDPDLKRLLYDPKQWTVTPDVREHDRRSVYLLVKRNFRHPFAEVFDQPDTQTSCPRRESSTHALQALEMLNGRTSNRLAEAFARRLQREAGADPARQVEWAFRLTTGRAPTTREKERALRFLKTQPLKEFALAMFNLNAFLYVN